MLQITTMTIEELDEFFSHVDFIQDLAMEDPSAHMYYISSYEVKKKKSEAEYTPMHRLRGVWISAQRIAYILFKKIDPIYKARIETTCTVHNCINPEHLSFNDNK